jgi:hypothetical protein
VSLTLDTPASERRDGRCVDCGQFTDRHTVHFHGPKPKFRGRPRAHLLNEGGGLVTRCDDPERARDLLIREYAYGVLGFRLSELNAEDREYVDNLFPLRGASVQRGRINVVAPDRDEVAWWWMQLAADAKGPGITTAVVWEP